jgi:hypothetical protein
LKVFQRKVLGREFSPYPEVALILASEPFGLRKTVKFFELELQLSIFKAISSSIKVIVHFKTIACCSFHIAGCCTGQAPLGGVSPVVQFEFSPCTS